MQGQTRIGHSLGEKERAQLLRLVQARDLMELARRAESSVLRSQESTPCPIARFCGRFMRSRTEEIQHDRQSQAELRDWERRYAGDWEFLRWPDCFSTSVAKFIAALARKIFTATALDLRPARSASPPKCSAIIAISGSSAASSLMPIRSRSRKSCCSIQMAAQRIREENFRVILDEAQDTDPAQFFVLLEVDAPAGATGIWLETAVPIHRGPATSAWSAISSNRFIATAPICRTTAHCMRRWSRMRGESLKFSVTFRLDQEQLDFVNATFREILNDREGRCVSSSCNPRPDVLPGQVIRVPLVAKELLPEGQKLKDYQKARIEAELARALDQKHRAENALRRFMARGRDSLSSQSLAANDGDGASPWIAGRHSIRARCERRQPGLRLADLTAHDHDRSANAYEIVGVLREIFGVSDHDLAVFSEGQGFRFRIDEALTAAGKVSSHLSALAEIRSARKASRSSMQSCGSLMKLICASACFFCRRKNLAISRASSMHCWRRQQRRKRAA